MMILKLFENNIMKKMIILAIFLLSYSFHNHANEWTQSEKGFRYNIEGLSFEQKKQARKAIELWQQQTADLLVNLKSLGISVSDFKYQQDTFIKLRFGLVYSYNSDNGNNHGVSIIAVSPGSIMSDLGILSGDVISKINDKSLRNLNQLNVKQQLKSATLLTSELKSLRDGFPLEIEIFRNGKFLNFKGQVDSYQVPAFSFAVIADEVNDSNCGTVRVISQLRPMKNLYASEIMSVDGKRFNSRRSLKLTPGVHQIVVKEHIQNKRLSNNIASRYRIKTLKLEVLKGRQYTIAAYFNDAKARDKENFWRPFVDEKKRHCSKEF